MTLILLDIDGTLVDSLELENKYFPQAVCESLGLTRMNTDWDSFSNPTDNGIIREVMREELGKLCHPEDIELCKERFIELLSGHLDQHPQALQPIPGAREFVSFLENHTHYSFAIVTAAWRFSAELKLTAAGFDYENWPMYSCTEYEYKKDAMKAALDEARKLHDKEFDQVLYVGDSRSDLRFSNELGYEFLGRGEDYAKNNIWGVEGVKDFTDLRLVEGKIMRAIQAN